jgi:hypothetical protein
MEDDDDNAEVEELPPKKKARQSDGRRQSASASATKKGSRTAQPPPPSTSPEVESPPVPVRPSQMNKFKNLTNWETQVKVIETIERGADGKLQVYFRMYVTFVQLDYTVGPD